MFARLSKLVRWQLSIFLVLTLIGTGYTVIAYVRVPDLLGMSTYPVVVKLPEAGGLYEHASVNYRGVPVGEVTEVRLADRGVEAEISLSNEARIPSAVVAEAHSMSAAGEQYIELTPTRDGGERLRAGSVIDHERNGVPVSTGELISNLDDLVSSVPHDSLRTVVDEMYAGFNGSGTDLARLLEATGPVLDDAHANLDVTRQLLTDGARSWPARRRLPARYPSERSPRPASSPPRRLPEKRSSRSAPRSATRLLPRVHSGSTGWPSTSCAKETAGWFPN